MSFNPPSIIRAINPPVCLPSGSTPVRRKAAICSSVQSPVSVSWSGVMF
jgi:hypothetical protein